MRGHCRAVIFVAVSVAAGFTLPGRSPCAAAVGITAADVLVSGGQQCCSLTRLADCIGAHVEWGPEGRAAKVSCNGQTWMVESGLPMIVDTQGNARAMPTCPVRRDGKMFVPTRAVVEAFGGMVTNVGHGLRVSLAGRSAVLPLAVKPPPAYGMDRLLDDIRDPRVPLEDVQRLIAKGDETRSQVDLFNSLAGPLKPGLDAISNSKMIKLLTRIPYVGEGIGLAQTAAGATKEAITLSEKLARFDETQSAPVRKALKAAWDVQQQPSADKVAAACPAWSAALPALNEQMLLNQKTTKYVGNMRLALQALDRFMREHPGRLSPGERPPDMKDSIRATDQFLVFLDVHRWQIRTQKEYLRQLVEDANHLR